jgi:hypothetical protein
MCHGTSSLVQWLTCSPCVVDHGFESWRGQTKDYKIGICSFSVKNAVLKSKSNDCLAHNQANVSE